MREYYMIDKRDRNVHAELKKYTLEELKQYFEPSQLEFPDLHREWADIGTIENLTDYLEREADGMEQPYTFETVKKETVTKAWKVYGFYDGEITHRQRESFCSSYKHDFSNEVDGTRIIEVFNSDKTGTNDYTIVRITRDTESLCEKEFYGQLADGIFENSRTGEIKQIPNDLELNRSAPVHSNVRKL